MVADLESPRPGSILESWTAATSDRQSKYLVTTLWSRSVLVEQPDMFPEIPGR